MLLLRRLLSPFDLQPRDFPQTSRFDLSPFFGPGCLPQYCCVINASCFYSQVLRRRVQRNLHPAAHHVLPHQALDVIRKCLATQHLLPPTARLKPPPRHGDRRLDRAIVVILYRFRFPASHAASESHFPMHSKRNYLFDNSRYWSYFTIVIRQAISVMTAPVREPLKLSSGVERSRPSKLTVLGQKRGQIGDFPQQFHESVNSRSIWSGKTSTKLVQKKGAYYFFGSERHRMAKNFPELNKSEQS